jgi:hypothetical protein
MSSLEVSRSEEENSKDNSESDDCNDEDYTYEFDVDDELESPQKSQVTQASVISSISVSENSSLSYCNIERAAKGRLVVKYLNPRIKKNIDRSFEFIQLLDGDSEKAEEIDSRYRSLNSGTKGQKRKAEGILNEYFLRGL